MTVSQTDFRRAILDPTVMAPDGLTNPDGVAATKRFDVYRNNVAASLTDALQTAFPVINKLIGDDNFKAVAGIYLRQHPPNSPLMMFYGADMPAFLAGFEPLQSIPYLADVAKLELAMRHAYHAADAKAVDAAVFQQIAGESLMAATFDFAPAVQLVRSRFPIHAIWQFNMVDDAPKPEAGGQNVLITRPEYDPIMTALPPGGGVFASALMTGETFGTALDAATTQVPEFDLSTTLGHLLAGGAITRLNKD